MGKQESPPLAAATVDDVQRDLVALRNDVSRLSQQLTDYVGTTGRKIARDTSQQLEHAVRERPLTAVAVAMGARARVRRALAALERFVSGAAARS
jgi:hypothetical protein